MLWKMVIALVLFNTFPSKWDEKVGSVVKLPGDPILHLPLQIEKLVQKEMKTGRRKDASAWKGVENLTLWRRQVEAQERSMSWELPENSRYTFTDSIIGQEGAGNTERSKSVSLS